MILVFSACVCVCVCAELLDAALEEEGGTLIARRVGEVVQNTLGAVVTVIDFPLGESPHNHHLPTAPQAPSNTWPITRDVVSLPDVVPFEL